MKNGIVEQHHNFGSGVMVMLTRPLIFGLFMSVIVYATDVVAFSDADLERYGRSGTVIQRYDDNQASGGSESSNRNVSVSQSSNKDGRDLWCQRGERNRQRIKTAEDAVQAAEAEYGRLKTAHQVAVNSNVTIANKYSSNADFSNQDKLANDSLDAWTRAARANSELNRAKDELRAIEDEAHRESIPSGWIRCQFE